MNFIRRYLMKKAARVADDGIMITLPNADKIKFQEQMVIDLLMRNGVDPNAIKSEQMLDNVLNQIEVVEKQNLANNIRAEARKAEKSGIMKSAKVMDMEGQEIPQGSRIMGGKEVKETEAEIAERIKNQNKQSLEKMKEKSKKKQDRMDDIFGDFDGLDDFASGGRVGLKVGVGKKGLKAMAEKLGMKFASDLEQPPKSKLRNMFKDFESRNPIEKEMDSFELNKPKDVDIGSIEEFYNDFVKAGGNPNIDPMKLMQAYRLKKAYPFNTPFIDKNGKVIGGQATQKMYPESPKFIIEDRDKLMEQINNMREGKMPRTPEGERTGLDVPPVPEGFKLSKEKLMKKFPEIDEDYADEIMDMDKDLQGRIIKMLENRRLDPKAYDKLLEKYGDTLEFQKEFDKVTRRKNNASGGIARLGFKAGGIDKARRAFLKVLGAGVAGVGALKTGLLKIGKGPGKQAVKEIVKTAPAPGKPEWFDSLVNKVISQGQDVTKDVATLDRTIVHRYKLDTDETVDVTQYLDSGDIKVTYDSPNNMAGEYVDLNYKAPEMLEEGKVVPADFKAIETEPRGVRSGPDDYDIEFDGENIVENVDELMSDTTKLKSLGGQNPSMREILEGTKKKKRVQAINEDNVEQAEYLDTKYGPAPDDFASGGIARMLGE